MRTGLGLLHLSPAALWSMTPREFSAAVEGALGTQWSTPTLARSAMDDLMSRYPDT